MRRRYRRRAALAVAAFAATGAHIAGSLGVATAGAASPAPATARGETRPVASRPVFVARPHRRHHARRAHRTAHQAALSRTDRIIDEMVAAGDRIARLPYIWGGGHGDYVGTGANTQLAAGYDCSGSVSFVLHAAGLLAEPEDSTELESYGEPGRGRLVTIYANAEHAWMVIDGRRFDTIALQETGTRWSDEIGSTAGYVAVHPAGL